MRLQAYSGCRFRFGLEEDYSEVCLYGDSRQLGLYPQVHHPKPLRASPRLSFDLQEQGLGCTLSQLYVDLWQLGRSAERWLGELEERMEAEVRILKKWVGRG